jgi:hypothetical protein
MCSPQYAALRHPSFAPAMTTAFMNPQPNLLAPNFPNQMAAQNLQRFFAQQMQSNLKNSENVNPNAPTPKRERMPREKKDKNHIKVGASYLYLD